MAIAKVGGAFGYLRKSIGSVTYSAPKLGIAQTRQQVARSKATEVSNPNTLGQILQRMKMANAARFFSAYETVVNKGLMSHSFEKIKYGQPSRLYFNQQALKKEDAVFVPKGIDFFVPGEYLVSEGSLQSLPWRNELDAASANVLFTVGTALTAENLTALANYNVAEGMQITVQTAIHKDGRYYPACARVIVGVGNPWSYTSSEYSAKLNEIVVCENGTYFGTADTLTIAGATIILSEGRSETNDKRSTETMLLVNGYQSLRSPEALQAAINSYVNGYVVNSLNSDWYLNQGNGQAFNGRVELVELTLTNQYVTAEIDRVFCGLVANGNEIKIVVFTSDGTASGDIYMPFEANPNILVKTGGESSGVDWLWHGEDVQEIVEFAQITPEIAAQGGFTLGA